MGHLAAGERLEGLGQQGLPLAADTFAKAEEQRPDHPNSHRLLGYALLRQGRLAEAFAAIEAGVGQKYPEFRFRGVEQESRQTVWNEIVRQENLEPYFTGYVQLYVIARMLVHAPRWQFLATKCVGFRADNDSFRALGQFGRLKMDVCGYETIVGDIFGRDSSLYHEAMSEVARTHARHHIVTAKRVGAPLSFAKVEQRPGL